MPTFDRISTVRPPSRSGFDEARPIVRDGDDDKDAWFRSPVMGWFEPVHWKGWAAAIGLGVALVAGMTLDDLLQRHGSPVLYYAVMIPVGVLTLALAWIIAGRIAR